MTKPDKNLPEDQLEYNELLEKCRQHLETIKPRKRLVTVFTRINGKEEWQFSNNTE